MSPEGITRLRERIDKLTDERDYARARMAKAPRAHPARCVFCGAKTKSVGSPATCRAHRDLVALDPFYSELAAA